MFIILFFIVIFIELPSVNLASFQFQADRISNMGVPNPSYTTHPDLIKKQRPTPSVGTSSKSISKGAVSLQSAQKLLKEIVTKSLSDLLRVRTTKSSQADTDLGKDKQGNLSVQKAQGSVSERPLATQQHIDHEASRSASVSSSSIQEKKTTNRGTSQNKTQSLPVKIKEITEAIPGDARRSSNRHHNLAKAVRTLSTFPFYPDGSTATSETPPTEVMMCGVAKCYAFQWTDPEDPVKFRVQKSRAPRLIFTEPTTDDYIFLQQYI